MVIIIAGNFKINYLDQNLTTNINTKGTTVTESGWVHGICSVVFNKRFTKVAELNNLRQITSIEQWFYFFLLSPLDVAGTE